MIRTRRLAAIAAAVLSLSACQGLKEAFTAHVDVTRGPGSVQVESELAQAVAIALQTHAPIVASAQLLERAGISPDDVRAVHEADRSRSVPADPERLPVYRI